MLKMNFKRDFGCGIRKAYVLQGLRTLCTQAKGRDHVLVREMFSSNGCTIDMVCHNLC